MVSPSLYLFFFHFLFVVFWKNIWKMFNVAELLIRTKQPKHENSTRTFQEYFLFVVFWKNIWKLFNVAEQEHFKKQNYEQIFLKNINAKIIKKINTTSCGICVCTYRYVQIHIQLPDDGKTGNALQMTFSKIVLNQLDLPTVGNISWCLSYTHNRIAYKS